MSNRRAFILLPAPHPSRARALEAVKSAPDGWGIILTEPTRSLEQNAAQWPLLEEISELKLWPVNGVPSRLTAEEWKDVLTAAFEKETARLVPGIDGGLVMLGRRTREYGKRKFSEWLEFLNSVAAQFRADKEKACGQ